MTLFILPVELAEAEERRSEKRSKARVLIEAALVFFRAKDFPEALELAERAQRIAPGLPEPTTLLGLIHQNTGEYKKAERSFRRALKKAPHHSDALKSLGLLLEGQEREAEAIEPLCLYLELDHWDDIEIVEKIANLLPSGVEYADKVTGVLREAWERTLSPRIALNYSYILRRLGRHDEAIPTLQFMVKKSPNPALFNELGIHLSKVRDSEAALKAFHQAVEIGEKTYFDENFANYLTKSWVPEEGYILPDWAQAYYLANLSSMYLEVGDKEQALATVNQALENDENLLHAKKIKARVLSAFGNPAEVEKYIEESLRDLSDESNTSDDVFELRKLWVEALIQGQKVQAALVLLQTMREVHPNELWVYIKTGELLGELDRQDEYKQILEHALERELPDPEKAYLSVNLFFLNERITGVEKAWQVLEPSLDQLLPQIFNYLPFRINQYLHRPDLPDFQREADFILSLHRRYPQRPEAIELAFQIHLAEEEYPLAQQVLEKALELDLAPADRLAFINNLGYVFMLQHRPEEAEKVLLSEWMPDQDIKEIKIKRQLNTIFYVPGEGGSVSNFYTNEYLVDTPDALGINLATAALAQGEVDRAVAYSLRVLASPVSYIRQSYDTLAFFIAYYRRERLTARAIWEEYEESPTVISAAMLQKYQPALYTWLTEEDAQPAGEAG
jgi:tetratricopeptide (TPR) repeat protein